MRRLLGLAGALGLLLSIASNAMALEQYEIEGAINDEWFIINDEKFQAKTYCLGWDEEDQVVFLEGSPNGACVSATLYNITRRQDCGVWCE
jgi:hypothetical protein